MFIRPEFSGKYVYDIGMWYLEPPALFFHSLLVYPLLLMLICVFVHFFYVTIRVFMMTTFVDDDVDNVDGFSFIIRLSNIIIITYDR